MPRLSQYFFKMATLFLIAGIAMGLHMGLSEDHSAMPAHAHVLLLGWVTSALFGFYYALQPAKAERRLAFVHFGCYVLGLIVMLPALYLKYTGYQNMEPLLGGGSMIVFLGVLIFAFILSSPDEVRAGR